MGLLNENLKDGYMVVHIYIYICMYVRALMCVHLSICLIFQEFSESPIP